MFSFIETQVFSRLVQEYLSDDEYRALQAALIENPAAGPVIPVRVACESCDGGLPDAGSGEDIGSFTICGEPEHHLVNDIPEECRRHDPRRCAEKDS